MSAQILATLAPEATKNPFSIFEILNKAEKQENITLVSIEDTFLRLITAPIYEQLPTVGNKCLR